MLRSTRIVVLLGLAVQMAAFLRTAIIAAALGTSPDVDAYNLGLIAPSFLSTVIGSWLQLSFIGRYTSLVTTGQIELAAAYHTRMLALLFGCTVLLSALCFVFPEPIMGLFMPAGQTRMIASAAAALRLSGLILIPIVLGDFIALMLNSHGRFFAAALAPLINALVSVLGLWLWPSTDLSALIWTLLIGSLAQGLILVAALRPLRLKFPVDTTAAKAEVGTTLMLGVPLLPAMMLANSGAAIVQFRAASLGEGVVAAYGYASRLHGALAQVLVIGLSTVLLPHLAALWARGEREEITVLFRRLARSTVLVVAYLTPGIILMGETATRILFQRGAFDAAHSAQVSWFWTLLSLSLFPSAFGTFIAKFCQAVRDAGSVLASAIISFAVTWIITWYGTSIESASTVIGAMAASVLAAAGFWVFWLARRVPIGPIVGDIGNAVLRISLMLAPAVAAERWLSLYTAAWHDVPALAVRASAYSLIVLCLLLATGSHRWFLARRPGQDKVARPMQNWSRSRLIGGGALAATAFYLAAGLWLNYSYVEPAKPAGKLVIRLERPFYELQGSQIAFSVKVPALEHMSDSMEFRARSPFMLYEGTRPLGPAHSEHVNIVRYGGGRFSHWNDSGFIFSSSDGTSPRYNGRTYWAVIPLTAAE